MALIICIIIAIYVLLIAWIWHNLGKTEKTKKILIILIGIVIIYLITLVVFNLSKIGISYPQEMSNQQEMLEKSMKKVYVAMFAGVNSLIILPYIAKLIDKIRENQIDKQQISKKLCIIMVIFIVWVVFEYGYMKDIQKGIVEMVNMYSLQSDIK